MNTNTPAERATLITQAIKWLEDEAEQYETANNYASGSKYYKRQDHTAWPLAQAVRELLSENELLRSASPLPAPAAGRIDQWQPIATALKDGTEIYVRYVTDDPRRVRWGQSRTGSGWYLTSAMSALRIEFEPTEWCLLKPAAAGREEIARVATDEMVTAAMREFELWTPRLRYKEAEGWHVNDRMGMRRAINAALALSTRQDSPPVDAADENKRLREARDGT